MRGVVCGCGVGAGCHGVQGHYRDTTGTLRVPSSITVSILRLIRLGFGHVSEKLGMCVTRLAEYARSHVCMHRSEVISSKTISPAQMSCLQRLVLAHGIEVSRGLP